MRAEYTYAVARIRALETSLFTKEIIEQLIACPTEKQCLALLEEKGWGSGKRNIEDILTREEEKIWEVVAELGIPRDKLRVLTYPKFFHNLKAAIKKACSNGDYPEIFYEDPEFSGEKILELIQEREFDSLPTVLQKVGKKAYNTLLQTGDGQLCDIMIDRATLEAIYQAGKKSGEPVLEEYANSYVAVANIKIALRGARTGKSYGFMQKAMAECDDISVDQLAKAGLKGVEGIEEYLKETKYSKGAEMLSQSPSAFERWCDNRIIEAMQSQKYEVFTIGPIVAYIIARQIEIKTVRMIVSGKQNHLSEESIRERAREMYV